MITPGAERILTGVVASNKHQDNRPYKNERDRDPTRRESRRTSVARYDRIPNSLYCIVDRHKPNRYTPIHNRIFHPLPSQHNTLLPLRIQHSRQILRKTQCRPRETAIASADDETDLNVAENLPVEPVEHVVIVPDDGVEDVENVE
jgi:hypothetical protein